MLALLTIPFVASMVLTSSTSADNAPAPQGFVSTLDLPPVAYTIGGAVVFLVLLCVTFAFRSTGKRH